jgi:hypothetical protein
MTDISGLESVWKKEFDPLDKDYSKYVSEEQTYLTKIEYVRDEYKKKLGVEYNEDADIEYKAHGLRGFFFIATKIAPLRRIKMKVEAHKKEDVSKIQNLAGSALTGLADATARDSVNGQEFTDLETAITKIQEARKIVDKAAKLCLIASGTETAAAIGDNMPIVIPSPNREETNTNTANVETIIALGMAAFRIVSTIGGKWTAWKATRAFNKAARAVNSLSVPQAVVPIVNQAIASDISSSTDDAIMMGGLSGMNASPFGNLLTSMADWKTARQLNQAKDHLHDVSGKLANIAGRLSLEKNDLAWSSLAMARKDDIAVEKFASTLENRTLSPELWPAFEMEIPKEFAKKKLPGLTLEA